RILFFIDDTPITASYSLSLHDALPIYPVRSRYIGELALIGGDIGQEQPGLDRRVEGIGVQRGLRVRRAFAGMAQNALDPHHRLRSEEHTSELQSPDHIVCRLLLEKKKT